MKKQWKKKTVNCIKSQSKEGFMEVRLILKVSIKPSHNFRDNFQNFAEQTKSINKSLQQSKIISLHKRHKTSSQGRTQEKNKLQLHILSKCYNEY